MHPIANDAVDPLWNITVHIDVLYPIYDCTTVFFGCWLETVPSHNRVRPYQTIFVWWKFIMYVVIVGISEMTG